MFGNGLVSEILPEAVVLQDAYSLNIHHDDGYWVNDRIHYTKFLPPLPLVSYIIGFHVPIKNVLPEAICCTKSTIKFDMQVFVGS